MDKKEQIEKILMDFSIGHTPGDQAELLMLLREIQKINGSLPQELQIRAAAKLNEPFSVIRTLIRRIPDLKEEPHLLQVTVCIGPRCQAKGGGEILKAIEKEFQIKSGQTANDGRLSLHTAFCLKKCKQAPNLKVNGETFGNMTPQKALEKLHALLK